LPVAINYNGSNPIRVHSFQAHMGSMRSPSRGRVQVRSKDPHQHPSLLFNYMSAEQDWREFRAGLRITREIIRQPALSKFAGREITPGQDLQTDAELDNFVRQYAQTAYHPACSNAMGYHDMAVVDGAGCVHGLTGLRVVDASIMPEIVSGNLNAPTIMMAEKIADMVRSRTPLPRVDIPYYRANGTPARN
jgi:choline dehydrogenase